MTQDEMEQMRSLIAAATPAPVEWGTVKGKTIEEHVADFRDSMSAETAVSSDLHGVYIAGTETIVCHTGNGPTSEANAKLITFALNNLGKLVDELEKRDIQKAVLIREIERLRSGIQVALDHHKWGRYREMAECLELLT